MFDAYHKWLGIPPEEQPPDHYRLLGIRRFESDPEVIAAAADRQMVHLRTFQAGPQAEACQRLLNEVARARVCLLDPEKKSAYDAELRSAVVEPVVAQPASAPWAWEEDGVGPARPPKLPRPKVQTTRARGAERSAPVRRLISIVSAAGAAVALALFLHRHVDLLRKNDLAQAGPNAARPPVAAGAQPASKRAPSRKPRAVTKQTPSPPLPPAPSFPLPAPQPAVPEPQTDPFPAMPPPAPGKDLRLPVVPLESAPGSPSPLGPAAEQAKPKVSVLAPPGALPAETKKPEVPAAGKPPRAEALFDNAMELVALRRYPPAYERLKEALKAEPNRYPVLFALGLLEAVVGHDWDNAEKHFTQCAKLEPKSVAVLNNLALVRLRTNKPGLAFRHWEAVLEAASPPPDEVVQNIARVWLLVKNRRLILSPEHLRALDKLARKADLATRARQVGAFRYLLPDGTSPLRWPDPPGLSEDWCMLCLGFGTVKCPDCVRGAVRSPVSRVLAADRDTGTVVTQTGTARRACPRCGGRGWVDCLGCDQGHQQSAGS